MAEQERNEENRRFGKGTRIDKERRDKLDPDWKHWEKRQSDDRRQGSRREISERREGEA
jgi:hypothetical protein